MSRTFQLLLVLALVGIVRVSGSRAHKNVTHGPHSCGGVDVPYPFAIVEDGGGGDYRAGFHVMCDAGEPVLHTTGGDGKPVKIGNFSMKAAEARVWLPVAWQCYDSSGKANGSDYRNLEFNEEGVYRISHARNNPLCPGLRNHGLPREPAGPGLRRKQVIRPVHRLPLLLQQLRERGERCLLRGRLLPRRNSAGPPWQLGGLRYLRPQE